MCGCSLDGTTFSSLLEMKECVSGLPSRLDRILDAIANQALEVEISFQQKDEGSLGGLLDHFTAVAGTLLNSTRQFIWLVLVG